MRSRRRSGWIWTISLLAGTAVLAAVLSSLFRLAVDAVPGYRHDVEQRVGQTIGHPLRIGSMALAWRGLEPTLDLRDVELVDEEHGASPALLRLNRLRLGFSLWRLVRADWAPVRAELRGLTMYADADEQGQWQLRGVATGGDSGGAMKWLQGLTQLRLLDCRLEIRDARLAGAPLELRLVAGEVIHRDDDFVMRADLTPPDSIAATAELSSELRGNLSQRASLRGGATLTIQELRGWPWLSRNFASGAALQLSDARLRIDGALVDGRVSTLAVAAQAGTAMAVRDGRTLAHLTQFGFEAKVQSTAQCWRAELGRLQLTGARGDWSGGSGSFECTRDAGGVGGSGSIALLRLDDLAPWLGLWKALPAGAQRVVDLRGDLNDVSVSTLPRTPQDGGEPPMRLKIAATLAGIGLVSEGGDPGFSGIDGRLLADSDGGELSLEHIAPRVNLPQVFAQALPVDTLNTVLHWRHEGRDWHLWAPAFDWQALSTKGKGRFDLRLADSADAHPPRLNVTADFSDADPTLLKPFMPLDWGADAREWLARALVSARVPKGSLVLDGPLSDFPFVEHRTGRWALDLQLVDATLAFAPDWPSLEAMHGQFRMRGHGLSVNVDGARLAGNSVDRIAAAINDLRTPQLVVDGSVHGDAKDFYPVLRQSPLHHQLSGLVDKTDASGAAQLDLHLQIALAETPMETHASGRVTVDDASLSVHGLDAPIRGIGGTVDFGAFGVAAKKLDGSFYDLPLTARIHAEEGVPTGVLEAQTQLPLAPDDGLAADYMPAWLRRQLRGTADLNARLALGGPDEGKLILTTSLAGVTSTLPPPLAKTAEEALPVSARIGSDAQAPLRVEIEVSNVMRIGLRFADTGGKQVVRGMEARLGDGAVPRAEANGIVVTGKPPELDLAPWLPFVADADAKVGGDPAATRPAAGPTLSFVSADLTPGRMHYEDFVLAQPHLHAVPAGSGYRVDFDGASAQGSLEWSPNGRGHVTGRLQHLKFEPLPAAGATADAKPNTAASPPFAPAQAPTVDLTVEQLAVGESSLGRFSLLTSRIADGQQLDALNLAGGDLQLDAKGAWRRVGAGDAGTSSAELSFSIDAPRIDAVLNAFGYARTLDAKQSNIKGALAWAPDPLGLQLMQGAGQIELNFHQGDLKSVDPGAGRALGLFNLYALPRRLLFDFRDVVAKGLSFDKLTGQFALADGQARTENVTIKSPSVRIEMRGRVGLAARDLDEHVTVYPDVTTGVTVGAALAGGPVGALIALVAQEALGKPFNKLSQFSYHITGPWDNPQIEHGTGAKAAASADASTEEQSKPTPEDTP